MGGKECTARIDGMAASAWVAPVDTADIPAGEFYHFKETPQMLQDDIFAWLRVYCEHQVNAYNFYTALQNNQMHPVILVERLGLVEQMPIIAMRYDEVQPSVLEALVVANTSRVISIK